jgi:hypothetical protein
MTRFGYSKQGRDFVVYADERDKAVATFARVLQVDAAVVSSSVVELPGENTAPLLVDQRRAPGS